MSDNARPSLTANRAIREALGWQWRGSRAENVPSATKVVDDFLCDLRALGYEVVPVTDARGSQHG